MVNENEPIWQDGLPNGKSTLDLAREMAGVSGLQTRRFRYREVGEDGSVEIGVHMGNGVVESVGLVKIDRDMFDGQAEKYGDGSVVIVWQDSRTGAPQLGKFDIV